MKKILKYNQLNEYNEFTSLSEDELLEMSNISSKKTGIDDVVIWVGPNPKYHGYRIKVSNLPNRISSENCFVITIPDFEIIGKVNTKFITNDKLNDIIKFINLNLDLIIKYSNYEIYTDDLLDNIKSIK